MFETAALPFAAIVIGFAGCAAIIAVAGTLLAARADRIADRTGLGEAVIGAVLLGGSTSLPGIVTSVVTAAQGYPALSISNAIGGIAVQTAFLGIADIAYRRANLEHAAASPTILTQGALLVTLLAIPIVALSGPEVTVLGVHPASAVLIGGYLYGVHLIRMAQERPMWAPRLTAETREDKPEEEPAATKRKGTGRLWGEFAALALATAAAGYGISQLGIALSARLGISETAVGVLFTAIATSLPELITSVAAVRRGALTLAVGGVIGGNAFDTLFLAFSDVAYRDGSLYHQFDTQNVFIMALTIMMTGILLLGLLRREKLGFAGIGFESTLILILYAASVARVLV
jgi:cation:H+ antiporter